MPQLSWSAPFSFLFLGVALHDISLSTAVLLRRSDVKQSADLDRVHASCRVPGTSKLRPSCRNRKLPWVRQGLVTGVGRSGTHTVSALFRAAGLELPHEKIGRDGSVSWVYAVDGSKVPRMVQCKHNWLRPAKVLFQNVVHLSRCPIKTISSLTTAKSCSLMFMMAAKRINIPRLRAIIRAPQPLLSNGMPRTSVLITSAKLWLAWSAGVAKQADVHIRVEDLSTPGVLGHLCRSTVGNHPSCNRMAYLHVGHIRRTKGNHRRHPDFSFQELSAAAPILAQKIKAEGTRLGYGQECFGPIQNHWGPVGLAIIPGVAAVALSNNATARLYHRLPKMGDHIETRTEILTNATTLAGRNIEEDLCICGEDANWKQDEQEDDDEDDLELCICVSAKTPGAKELLSAAFHRELGESSND